MQPRRRCLPNPPAARRRGGHHAIQLPCHGPDMDVRQCHPCAATRSSSNHRKRTCRRACSTGEGGEAGFVEGEDCVETVRIRRSSQSSVMTRLANDRMANYQLFPELEHRFGILQKSNALRSRSSSAAASETLSPRPFCAIDRLQRPRTRIDSGERREPCSLGAAGLQRLAAQPDSMAASTGTFSAKRLCRSGPCPRKFSVNTDSPCSSPRRTIPASWDRDSVPILQSGAPAPPDLHPVAWLPALAGTRRLPASSPAESFPGLVLAFRTPLHGAPGFRWSPYRLQYHRPHRF